MSICCSIRACLHGRLHACTCSVMDGCYPPPLDERRKKRKVVFVAGDSSCTSQACNVRYHDSLVLYVCMYIDLFHVFVLSFPLSFSSLCTLIYSCLSFYRVYIHISSSIILFSCPLSPCCFPLSLFYEYLPIRVWFFICTHTLKELHLHRDARSMVKRMTKASNK